MSEIQIGQSPGYWRNGRVELRSVWVVGGGHCCQYSYSLFRYKAERESMESMWSMRSQMGLVHENKSIIKKFLADAKNIQIYIHVSSRYCTQDTDKISVNVRMSDNQPVHLFSATEFNTSFSRFFPENHTTKFHVCANPGNHFPSFQSFCVKFELSKPDQ